MDMSHTRASAAHCMCFAQHAPMCCPCVQLGAVGVIIYNCSPRTPSYCSMYNTCAYTCGDIRTYSPVRARSHAYVHRLRTSVYVISCVCVVCADHGIVSSTGYLGRNAITIPTFNIAWQDGMQLVAQWANKSDVYVTFPASGTISEREWNVTRGAAAWDVGMWLIAMCMYTAISDANTCPAHSICTLV